MKSYIVATLNDFSPLPKGTIYLGDGEFDMIALSDKEKARIEEIVKDKKTEHDENKNLIFKKSGYTKQVRAERI